MLSKKWMIAPPAPPTALRAYRGISPVLAQILYNRGLTTQAEAQVFLNAEGGTSFNPFDMTDMAKAVGRARQAIKKNEKIVIYGDFDADGATSTALLMHVFKALGAQVDPYIPHRVDEGYGLNANAVEHLASQGAGLLITVDCGIRSVEEVNIGARCGLDIIITDHHSLGPERPAAYAVINPKQDKPPVEPMLAGVGVAYKFAEALLLAQQQQSKSRRRSTATQAPIELETLLDLVAIGTVADLAPLDRIENRLLVRRGLAHLNRAARPGVRALLEVAGIDPGSINATDIGFGIGPRINAAGRLESGMLAYELLYTSDERRAQELAGQLQDLNDRRRQLTRDAQAVVQEALEAEGETDMPLIFASHPGFSHGVVGLVAGRITEAYYRPCIVLREGETESNASCRSIPQFDITNALDHCADLLVRHGGHAQAAGFTVLNQNIDALRARMTEIAGDHLSGQDLRPTLEIDAAVDMSQLSEELFTELQMLEPTGHANPAPVFMAANVQIADWRLVGSDQTHLKLKVARPGSAPIDAIGFNLGEWATRLDEPVDLAFALEMNEWNGRHTLQLNLKDIRANTP